MVRHPYENGKVHLSGRRYRLHHSDRSMRYHFSLPIELDLDSRGKAKRHQNECGGIAVFLDGLGRGGFPLAGA